MNIAIDFDGTYSAAPDAFREVVNLFESMGHSCYIVTGRQHKHRKGVEEVVLQSSHIDPSDIFFAGHGTKREVVRKNNIDIDVWIDDSPKSILGL